MAQDRHQDKGPQSRGRAATERGGDAGPGTAAGPGVTALRAMRRGTGGDDPVAVAGVMRRFPTEREAMFGELQQTRGNAFTQDVSRHMGQVEKALPGGVGVDEVRAGFTIPGGRELAGVPYAAAVSTTRATRVTASMDNEGVELSFAPGLFLDLTWPAQNLNIRAVRYNWGAQSVRLIADGDREIGGGVIDLRSVLIGKLNEKILPAVQGTAAAQRGWNPSQDPNLGASLNQIVGNVSSMFKSKGPQKDKVGKDGKPVDSHEVTELGAGATFVAHTQRSFANGALAFDANTRVSVDVEGAGSLADVEEADGLQQSLRAANMQRIRIWSDGIIIKSGGKPVMKIQGATIERGGHVNITSFELMGKLANASRGEGVGALLVGIIGVAAGSPDIAAAGIEYANRPKVVSGLGQQVVQRELEEEIKKLVLRHGRAIPGVDIGKLMGIV